MLLAAQYRPRAPSIAAVHCRRHQHSRPSIASNAAERPKRHRTLPNAERRLDILWSSLSAVDILYGV
jgi:hypothetical protein